MLEKSTEALTYWEHLRELVSRLRYPFMSIIISAIVVMVFPITLDFSNVSPSNPWYPTITSLVINRIRDDFLPSTVELIPLRWFAPLQVYIYISLILAFVISSPILAYQIYQFIRPALYERESKVITPFIISFVGLFITGFFIGYILVVPATLRMLLLSAEPFGLSLTYEFAQFFSFVAGGLMISGFIMTLPIYLVPLVRFGVIKVDDFKKNRKYIYGSLIVLICILDPDPSFITEAFLAIPLFVTMEIAIRIAHRYEES